MKCPKCGSTTIDVLESRKGTGVSRGYNYGKGGQPINEAAAYDVAEAIEQWGTDNWPFGLATRLAEKHNCSRQAIHQRKKEAIKRAEEPNPTKQKVETAHSRRLIKEISAPFIRRRRQCSSCSHRFTTYELAEADLEKLQPLDTASSNDINAYAVMKAYADAIRVLERSMVRAVSGDSG
tara:strand:+ start:997 stop:1533 length:537 start_codon:yes stop_codon:yes gene_type:complete